MKSATALGWDRDNRLNGLFQLTKGLSEIVQKGKKREKGSV